MLLDVSCEPAGGAHFDTQIGYMKVTDDWLFSENRSRGKGGDPGKKRAGSQLGDQLHSGHAPQESKRGAKAWAHKVEFTVSQPSNKPQRKGAARCGACAFTVGNRQKRTPQSESG